MNEKAPSPAQHPRKRSKSQSALLQKNKIQSDTRVAPSNQSNAMVDWFMIHSCRCARLDCIHERGWSVEKKQSVYSTVYTKSTKIS